MGSFSPNSMLLIHHEFEGGVGDVLPFFWYILSAEGFPVPGLLP
jgi:hypothetical protein